MINEFYFLSELYDDIYCWLAANTPGEHITKNYFIKNNKKLWNRIRDKFIELEGKSDLSLLEKDFLKCKYIEKHIEKYDVIKNMVVMYIQLIVISPVRKHFMD